VQGLGESKHLQFTVGTGRADVHGRKEAWVSKVKSSPCGATLKRRTPGNIRGEKRDEGKKKSKAKVTAPGKAVTLGGGGGPTGSRVFQKGGKTGDGIGAMVQFGRQLEIGPQEMWIK